MKKTKVLLFSLLITSLYLISFGCTTDSEKNENEFYNQTGVLSWQGSPAADGLGILFTVGETQYGAPGTKDDFSQYFPENSNEVDIEADFRVTGESTIRGWGTTFPEIEFIHIEVIE